MSNFSLDGKVAVITGAASGIGKSIATVFYLNNAFVHILDKDKDKGGKMEIEIREKGGQATYHYCDVAQSDEVNKTISEITGQHNIDILVNNAGISHIGNLENSSDEDLDNIISVNIKGVYYCMLACVPNMKENGGGVILNMASVAAHVGLSDRFAYSMSKGAVLTMTYSVAKDYIQDNIRCNSISPARVHTPFVDGYLANHYPGKEKEMFEQLSKTQPIGRMAQPEEVAHLALYLCSDEASFITGTDYTLDGTVKGPPLQS